MLTEEGWPVVGQGQNTQTPTNTGRLKCTRIGGHTYYQNIFIHGGCVHVQENKKEI